MIRVTDLQLAAVAVRIPTLNVPHVVDLRTGEPVDYAPEPRGSIAVKSARTGRVSYYLNKRGN